MVANPSPAGEPTLDELFAWEHAKRLHDRLYRPHGCRECFPDGPPEPMPDLAPPTGAPLVPPPPDARQGEMEPLSAAMARFRRKLAIAQGRDPNVPLPPPDPEPEPQCQVCKDAKFLRKDLPLGDPEFGVLFPCPVCYAPQLEARRLAALLGGAGVPPLLADATFDNYPVTPGSRASFEWVRDWWERLKAGRALHNSLFLWGDASVGKSSMAASILHAWTAYTGIEGTWIEVAEALDAIRETYSDHAPADAEGRGLVKRLGDAPFLVLDDLGVENQTPWVAEKLMQIIGARHGAALPTIITSNFSLDVLETHLSGAVPRGAAATQLSIANMRAKRLLDRLLEMADIHEFRGDNLRDPDTRTRLALDRPKPLTAPLPFRGLPNTVSPVDPAELVPDEEDNTAF